MRGTLFLVLSLGLALAVPGVGILELEARQTDPGTGLHGRIVDARSGVSLEGAWVTVEPAPGGLLPTADGNGRVTDRWSRSTDDAGWYRFPELPSGRYLLHVQRLGYRSTTVEVDYHGSARPRISVGLRLAPVELEPLTVVGHRPDPPARRGPRTQEERNEERVQAERLRQLRDLTPDARTLTSSDLVEAGTLGETDLLRALHRLPGVAAADDWSAEPWTRGAHWDETRIFYDGLPLRNPVHAGGAFTSVSPDAVGAVSFHPGVRPVDGDGSAAGAAALTSRSAAGREESGAVAQLSVFSARLSTELPLGPGRGLALSGRHTYVHHLTDETRTGNEIPFSFSDLSGRWDHTLGEEASLEVAGLVTRDRLWGDVEDELKGIRGSWGNALARGTVELRRWGLRTRLTLGAVRYAADLEEAPFDATDPALEVAVQPPPLVNRVATDQLRATVAPRTRDGTPPPWTVGWERLGTRTSYDGPAPWPYPGSVDAGHLQEESALERHALWGTTRVRLAPAWELSVGGRLELREDGADDPVTWGPRAALAWRPLPDLRLSAAVGRHHQVEQSVAAAGFTLGPELAPSHLWALAGRGVPTLESDQAAVGAEMWVRSGWLASATLWARESRGRLVPAPDSGYVRARPPLERAGPGPGWTVASGTGAGLEIGLRRLAGSWTGSLSWSLSRATLEAEEVRFAAPGDRRHVVDAAVFLPASASTRVGATLTAATGAPFTRYYPFRCPGDRYCPEASPGEAPVLGFVEPAHGQRLPGYLSLDLHAEREGTMLGRPYGLFVQLRNVLDRANPSAYTGSALHCPPDGQAGACSVTDAFEGGMPFMPLLGFWIRL